MGEHCYSTYRATPKEMFDALKPCCLISRIHARSKLSSNPSGFIIQCDEFPYPLFLPIKQAVASNLLRRAIEFRESAVCSSFNSVQDYRLHASFVDVSQSVRLRQSVVNIVSKDHNLIPPRAPMVQFGFLGRTMEPDGSRFITDGLASQCSSKIALDYTVHLTSSDDMLAFRIAHELMHVLGYNDEQQADCYALRSLQEHYPMFLEVAHSLHKQMRSTFPSFVARVEDSFADDKSTLQAVINNANQLEETGLFPVSSNEFTVTKSFSFNGFTSDLAPTVDSVTALFL